MVPGLTRPVKPQSLDTLMVRNGRVVRQGRVLKNTVVFNGRVVHKGRILPNLVVKDGKVVRVSKPEPEPEPGFQADEPIKENGGLDLDQPVDLELKINEKKCFYKCILQGQTLKCTLDEN